MVDKNKKWYQNMTNTITKSSDKKARQKQYTKIQ
jgi:hypothetical protein